MHEDGVGVGLGHKRRVDLIRCERGNALGPDALGFAHGDPDVGIDHVRALHGRGGVGDEVERRARLRRDGLTLGDELRIGEVALGCAGREVHAHLRAADHEGVAHVEARIAHVDELFALQLAKMFLDRQEIGQNLRRMELVCQAVPDRDARVFRQILHDLLPKAAIFNAVEHPA